MWGQRKESLFFIGWCPAVFFRLFTFTGLCFSPLRSSLCGFSGEDQVGLTRKPLKIKALRGKHPCGSPVVLPDDPDAGLMIQDPPCFLDRMNIPGYTEI